MAEPDNLDGFAKGCALIQSNLHVNADDIETEEEWAVQYSRALWLECWRNRNPAEVIVHLFGGGKD